MTEPPLPQLTGAKEYVPRKKGKQTHILAESIILLFLSPGCFHVATISNGSIRTVVFFVSFVILGAAIYGFVAAFNIRKETAS